ncbi:MAG: ABC transporter ATP-binding protein, partial [Acidimicrobiia bacterium]
MDMGFSHWMALESAMHGERSRRRFTKATLRRIAAFARPHRKALIAFLVLSVISATLAVATPVLAGWVVDALIKNGSEDRVLFLAAAIALVAILD